MAELQKREPQATWPEVAKREHEEGPQQQHVYSNVGKTWRVTGTVGRILHIRALGKLMHELGQAPDALAEVLV